MRVVVTYRVDRNLYHAPGTKHPAYITTTEYVCRNDMLVHLQIGENIGIRVNNLMRYVFEGGRTLASEQFLSGKSSGQGKPKPITRSTFEEKRKRFDMRRTAVQQEILEEYAYTNRIGNADKVQIVITVKGGTMATMIDFEDAEQHQNFVPPTWLVQ